VTPLLNAFPRHDYIIGRATDSLAGALGGYATRRLPDRGASKGWLPRNTRRSSDRPGRRASGHDVVDYRYREVPAALNDCAPPTPWYTGGLVTSLVSYPMSTTSATTLSSNGVTRTSVFSDRGCSAGRFARRRGYPPRTVGCLSPGRSNGISNHSTQCRSLVCKRASPASS